MKKDSLRFCFFNPFSWPNQKKRPPTWPYPNDDYDPQCGRAFFQERIELFVFAEQCLFDWIGVGEDHGTAFALTPNPALILAALCYLTKVIRLAILGMPLPLLNPIRAAEECAMLDAMSGGRLVAGFIRGVPQNYASYNMDPEESREPFTEALELIAKSWTATEVFGWSGKYYQFPKVSLWPKTVQVPHPPLVFSANSPESAVLGAKHKAMIGSIHLYSRDALDLVDAAMNAYRVQARADGWEPGADRFLIGLPTCIAESDELAEALLEPALNYQVKVLSGTYDAQKREIAKNKPGYGFTPVEENPPVLRERIAAGTVLCGSPATVANQIQRLRQRLGVGVISMHFQVGNMGLSAVRDGMVLFRDHVRLHFQDGGNTK